MKTCGLTQQIQNATRITKHCMFLIDHAIVNREKMFYQWGTYDPGISDHSLIYIARKKKKQPKDGTKVTCRNYNTLDDKKF